MSNNQTQLRAACYLIAAQSADGFIAQDLEVPSTSWTSREDARFFQQQTQKSKVIVMGNSTYQTIGRPLPKRVNIVYSQSGHNPQLEEQSQLELGKTYYTQLEPAELLIWLASHGWNEVALCGGSSIYNLFWEEAVVDELFITTEKNIKFGQGMRLFGKKLTITELEKKNKIKLIEKIDLSAQSEVARYEVC